MTFGAFARGWLDNYASHLRDGSHFALGVNAQGALTDRIGVFGELAWNQRHAQSEVWDLHYYSARLNLDYSLGHSGTLYLNGEYRRGNTVSDGRRHTGEREAGAGLRARRRVSRQAALRLPRTTPVHGSAPLGYNLPLGTQASIDISWRRAQATPTDRPDFDVQGSLRYIDNQYSLFFLKVF